MKTLALLLLAVTPLLGGCPGSSRGGAPPTHCTKLNAQCSLGNGVLGVCSESLCAPDQTAPCMKCTSQH